MWKFVHDDDDNDGAKAIAIPRVFSENSQAKNAGNRIFFFPTMFYPFKNENHHVYHFFSCYL